MLLRDLWLTSSFCFWRKHRVPLRGTQMQHSPPTIQSSRSINHSPRNPYRRKTPSQCHASGPWETESTPSQNRRSSTWALPRVPPYFDFSWLDFLIRLTPYTNIWPMTRVVPSYLLRFPVLKSWYRRQYLISDSWISSYYPSHWGALWTWISARIHITKSCCSHNLDFSEPNGPSYGNEHLRKLISQKADISGEGFLNGLNGYYED